MEGGRRSSLVDARTRAGSRSAPRRTLVAAYSWPAAQHPCVPCPRTKGHAPNDRSPLPTNSVPQVRSRFVSGGRQEGGEADEEDEQGSDGEGAAAAGGGGGGGGGGQEDFRPFLSCLARLGLKLQSQDVSNRMFVVWVLRKGADKEGGKGGANGKAGAIPWPPLKACVYKKR